MQETKVLRVTKESHKQVSDLAERENILKVDAAARLIEREAPIDGDRLRDELIDMFMTGIKSLGVSQGSFRRSVDDTFANIAKLLKTEGEAREAVYSATEANYNKILDLSKMVREVRDTDHQGAVTSYDRRAELEQSLIDLVSHLEGLAKRFNDLEELTRAVAEVILTPKRKAMEIKQE